MCSKSQTDYFLVLTKYRSGARQPVACSTSNGFCTSYKSLSQPGHGHARSLVQRLMSRAIARYKSVKLWTDTPHFPPEALAQLERGMLSAGAIKRTPGFAGLVAEDVTESALA